MEVLALDHACYELKLIKLCCEVLAFNTLVIKLHKKFGFKAQDILCDYCKRNESLINVYRLTMLSEDWADNREKIMSKLIPYYKD